MRITSESFQHNHTIPDEFAFCVHDAKSHVALGPNRNPHLSWSDVPADARSLVLICVDTDVPTVGDDVNQEGRTISASLPRCDFYHWAMIDIPPTCKSIAAGECSEVGRDKAQRRPGTSPRACCLRVARTRPIGGPRSELRSQPTRYDRRCAGSENRSSHRLS